jgi:hypothetical protein
MPVTCFACERCLSKKACRGLPGNLDLVCLPRLSINILAIAGPASRRPHIQLRPRTVGEEGCLAEQEAERAHRLRSMYSPLSARSPFPLRICDQHQMIAILIYADRRNRCCIRSSERLTSAFFLLLPSVPSRLVFDVILLPYRDLSLHRLLLRPSFALPPLPN